MIIGELNYKHEEPKVVDAISFENICKVLDMHNTHGVPEYEFVEYLKSRIKDARDEGFSAGYDKGLRDGYDKKDM